MATFVDYYDILGLQPGCGDDAVREAVKRELRIHQKKTNHSDTERRRDAEQRVAAIIEAERVLTDPARRQAFERDRSSRPAPQADYSSEAGQQLDWIERTKRHLDEGDLRGAAYAAREATTLHPHRPDAWGLRAHVSAQLGRLDDAEYELKQAIGLDPNDPATVFDLGAVYESGGRWDAARAQYEQAKKLDPANSMYDLGVVSILIQTDRAAEAIPIVERVLSQEPDNDAAHFYAAIAYHDATIDIGTVLEGGATLITQAEQAQQAQRYMDKAAKLRVHDAELRASLKDMRQKVEWANQRQWAFKTMAEVNGWGTLILQMVCVVYILGAIAITPWSQGAGGGLLGTVIAGAGFYGLSKWLQQPGWKLNRRALRMAKTTSMSARFVAQFFR